MITVGIILNIMLYIRICSVPEMESGLWSTSWWYYWSPPPLPSASPWTPSDSDISTVLLFPSKRPASQKDVTAQQKVFRGGKWEEKLTPPTGWQEDGKVLKMHGREAACRRVSSEIGGTSLAGGPNIRRDKWDLPGFQQVWLTSTHTTNHICSVDILFKCTRLHG